MAVDVTEAARRASLYAQKLYEDKIGGIQLEEVERGQEQGRDVWRITLSFYLPTYVTNPVERLMGQILSTTEGTRVSKHLKVFVVAADSGDVIAMKIRPNPVGE